MGHFFSQPLTSLWRGVSVTTVLTVAVFASPQGFAATGNPLKAEIIASVDAQAQALSNLSDEIWRAAEIAFQETKSSDALVRFAEGHGFRVTRGQGEIPTAFIAEYGSGRPIIGIMGEFDALPGLSQATVPERSPLQATAAATTCSAPHPWARPSRSRT